MYIYIYTQPFHVPPTGPPPYELLYKKGKASNTEGKTKRQKAKRFSSSLACENMLSTFTFGSFKLLQFEHQVLHEKVLLAFFPL